MLLIILAALAVPAKAAPVDPDQKVRCQRQEVTGSLIDSVKICHTVAEWRRMAEAARNDAERAVDAGRICPTCRGN